MAIGNKGFYATTQAPNVDFGAMVDKGIDKKLARDAAEDAKRLKAKADKEAKKKKLSVEWDKVKQTGRNMYDTSTNSYVKKTISDTQALLRQYDASNDPEERAMLEDKIKMNELNVQTLAGSTDVFKGLIDKVTGNLGNYNEDSADFFTNLMTNVDKGNVRVYSDENGMQMYEVFDTDPNDDIDDSYTISASDLMKEPMLASDYYTKKNTFVDNIQLQKTQRGSRLYNVTEEKRTKETIKQVEVFAKKLTKDKAEMFKFFVDEHGGGTEGINAWNNKTDEEYKEYEDKFYKETYNDALTAIQGSKTLGFGIKPGDGDGGKKTIEDGGLTWQNKKSGISISGFNDKGNPTTHSTNKYTVGSNPTDSKGKQFIYKEGDKDITVSEIVVDPEMGTGIVLTSSNRISLGDTSSEGISGDGSSSRVGDSLRVSIEKGKPTVIYKGQPGYSTIVDQLNKNYEGGFDKIATQGYNEMLKLSDRYGEIDELRDNGGTKAQINELKEELVAEMAADETKLAKEGRKSRDAAKRKTEQDEKRFKKYQLNSKFIDKIDLNNLDAFFDKKGNPNFKELKDFAKGKLSKSDFENYFPEEKTSSTAQQTKSNKIKLNGQ